MNGPSDLVELVRTYRAGIDAGSHGLALANLETTRPMWHRSEFEPGHFTASGFVLSPDGSAMLLVKHGRLNRWLQPGGHFEVEDQSVEAAARREVAEETGVTDLLRVGSGLVRIDAHPIPPRSDEPAHTHIDLGVGFIAGDLHIGPIDEVLDARWVPLDRLADYDPDEAVRGGAAVLRRLAASR
jgi:8-oxo-dGTP pyrophosphatase MutT (NUDIX family)